MNHSYTARQPRISAVILGGAGAGVGLYALLGASWASGRGGVLGTVHLSFGDIRRVASGTSFPDLYFAWIAWTLLLATLLVLGGALVPSNNQATARWAAFVLAVTSFLATVDIWSAMYTHFSAAHLGAGVWISMAGSALLAVAALRIRTDHEYAWRRATVSALRPGWYPSPSGHTGYWDGYAWTYPSLGQH